MSKKTINNLIISIIVLTMSIGVCAYLFYEIDRKGVQLEEQVAILAENNSKENTYLNIKRTVQETEEERSSIANKFFKDENNNAINFLNEVESMAPSFGLDFKTEALDSVVDKDKKVQAIKMSFVYSGNKTAVMNFTKLMENIPYHSYIESLFLKELSADVWEGKMTLIVSVKPS